MMLQGFFLLVRDVTVIARPACILLCSRIHRGRQSTAS